MKSSVVRIVFATLLAATLSHAQAVSCPTVTKTASVCSTCIHADCIELKTIDILPGCPDPPATFTTSYPCQKKKGPLRNRCPGGCGTQYVYATEVDDPTPTTEAPSCPTVTKTTARCSTCMYPMCEMLSTISSVCGCPTVVATHTTGFPCSEGCHGGCGVEYVFATETPVCD